MGAYVLKSNRYARGWDAEHEMITYNPYGDGDAEHEYTMSIVEWYNCLNGVEGCAHNWSKGEVEEEFRLGIIGEMEKCVLRTYYTCLPMLLFAQESELDKLAQRQAAFGRTIPQEKVFIHMDNSSYQLGDTIWFSAYLRRTDTGKPSDVSGVLYVELYGQEGYMIERKLIQMKEGK